ncbi:MAG: bifunctional riboflavin kinase/FAD synthetase [candidate division Zixibacteria bacterium]|nr:bifunctional riboflavin kinase/FAD synthetase [candidate division Zixibacteria bacterium]
MEVIHNILDDNFKFDKPTTLTIGNFDGVHKGHISILHKMYAIAEENDSVPVLVTFQPHPLHVLTPNYAPKLLSITAEKLDILEKYQVPVVVLFPFNKAVSQYSADWFLDEVLLKRLKAKHIVIGINHTFGRNREGDVNFLREKLPSRKVELDVVEPVRRMDKDMVSSSEVRSELLNGDFESAQKMLGHPYPLYGEIIGGRGVGTELGYPTINLKLRKRKLVPPSGVYACMIEHTDERLGGMLYIGTRPTFGENEMVIEIACFCRLDIKIGDFLKVFVLKYFRGDRKFENTDLLVNQIKEDEKSISDYLGKQKIKLTT